MIREEAETARRCREKIEFMVSELINNAHEKMSWSNLERHVGVSTQTLVNAWSGKHVSLRTAICILDRFGYSLEIKKRGE